MARRREVEELLRIDCRERLCLPPLGEEPRREGRRLTRVVPPFERSHDHGLVQRGLEASFIDEDWGWQVHGKRPDESVLEISIYHNPEEDPAAEDDWALMLRSLRKGRMLGIVPRFQEAEIDAGSIAILEDVFRRAGIQLRQTPPR